MNAPIDSLSLLTPITDNTATKLQFQPTNKMGYFPTEERKRMEVEELKRTLKWGVDAVVTSSPMKEDPPPPGDMKRRKGSSSFDVDGVRDDEVVCVTSGLSFLGLAIVNCLLSRGYSVRILVDSPDEIEKLRELETAGEIRRPRHVTVHPVVAKLSEIGSLSEAFRGCRGLFHSGGFIDPSGLSGYTKSMAEIEVKACENVMEACSRTPSMRKCVLTSSLLACLWRDGTSTGSPPVINHESWSDESLCVDKKLWYALGKLRAEKAAWRISEDKGLNLASICPGLIQGPDFCSKNPSATFAYLKGADEMFERGVLAAVDVTKLADAHISVYEAMDWKANGGRYIAYDRIIERREEAEHLAERIGMPMNRICGDADNNLVVARFRLSNRKLLALRSRTLRDCYYQNSVSE